MGAGTNLRHLPTDVWAEIFAFVDEQQLVMQFDVLCNAGVFENSCRLTTFWEIQCKMHRRRDDDPFVDFPDTGRYAHVCTTLTEMGLPKEKALTVTRDANGDLGVALSVLGWD